MTSTAAPAAAMAWPRIGAIDPEQSTMMISAAPTASGIWSATGSAHVT
jgi:hypothetical protein